MKLSNKELACLYVLISEFNLDEMTFEPVGKDIVVSVWVDGDVVHRENLSDY